MAISWQTGEPPCGVRVLVEWMYRSGNPRTEVGVVSSPSRAMFCMSVDTVFLNDITIIRWSTLDDDRAAKAMGALEKMAREMEHEEKTIQVCAATKFILVDIVSDDGNDLEARGEGLSLIEAIEKLTEAGNGPESD